MERSVKARKQYACDQCGAAIKKGDMHIFGEGRGPRYDGGYVQVGVQFYSYRLCLDTEACNRRMLRHEASEVERGHAG